MFSLIVLILAAARCSFLPQENVIWRRIMLEAMPIWGSLYFAVLQTTTNTTTNQTLTLVSMIHPDMA